MGKIYLISDTHFNHANIIKYCNIPFKNVKEMNKTLIKNWNNIVRDKDIVYFLGDFVLSKNKVERAKEFIELLNGEIIFIKGNHDKFGEKFRVVEHNGYRFMLIHNPNSSYTFNFDGWLFMGIIMQITWMNIHLSILKERGLMFLLKLLTINQLVWI